MTRKEQDAIANAIALCHKYDGNIADPAASGSAQRAVSRLAQSIADKLAYGASAKFDRKRFVERAGLPHI